MCVAICCHSIHRMFCCCCCCCCCWSACVCVFVCACFCQAAYSHYGMCCAHTTAYRNECAAVRLFVVLLCCASRGVGTTPIDCDRCACGGGGGGSGGGRMRKIGVGSERDWNNAALDFGRHTHTHTFCLFWWCRWRYIHGVDRRLLLLWYSFLPSTHGHRTSIQVASRRSGKRVMMVHRRNLQKCSMIYTSPTA